MSEMKISSLVIYPVKSMRQVCIESATIDMGGLKDDRRWMVVDATGKMVTQREQSRLCLIQPELVDGGLCLRSPTMPDIKVAIPRGDDHVKVSVWTDTCNAIDAGDEVSLWLSQFLGITCRLVYFPDNEVRVVDQTYAHADDRTAFSDGFPVLLLTQASLDDLNSRLENPVPMARFRPNIVISGCKPYEEDEWKQLSVGGFTLRIVKPCSRCVIPSIDIDSAERTGEPTRTLSRYRRIDNEILFGQNCMIDGVGEIKTGMSVELIE